MLYKEGVLNKPKILVLNKMDCAGAEDEYGIIREKVEAFEGMVSTFLKEIKENWSRRLVHGH